MREEAVRACVTSVLDDLGFEGSWELEWWSVYSANTLALDGYRDNRIFFVGDSAHMFAGELANPHQMTAFTYNESPAVLPDDPAFSGGPEVGAAMPEVEMSGTFLSAQLGKGFTVLCFDSTLAQQINDAWPADDLLTAVSLPHPSAVSEKFAAHEASAYLVRPDMHIAARWREATAKDVINGFRSITFREGATQ